MSQLGPGRVKTRSVLFVGGVSGDPGGIVRLGATWRIFVKTFDTPTRKLRVTEAATFLSVSKSWLDKKRITGDGPAYIKAVGATCAGGSSRSRGLGCARGNSEI